MDPNERREGRTGSRKSRSEFWRCPLWASVSPLCGSARGEWKGSIVWPWDPYLPLPYLPQGTGLCERSISRWGSCRHQLPVAAAWPDPGQWAYSAAGTSSKRLSPSRPAPPQLTAALSPLAQRSQIPSARLPACQPHPWLLSQHFAKLGLHQLTVKVPGHENGLCQAGGPRRRGPSHWLRAGALLAGQAAPPVA